MSGPESTAAPPTDALARVAARVGELAEGYRPPDYAEIPNANAPLFLSAIDHRSGYRGRYLIGGRGPYEGSALLWATALRAERRDPGLLSAARLADADESGVAELFRIGGETVAGAGERARLWRDLAAGLRDRYGGDASGLIDAAAGRLGGAGGMLALLAEFEAYADPLEKKSFLFCKIAARRGWLRAADPEKWEVCADNVLMRLALRSGLVRDGPVEEVRAATRDAFKRVAERAGMSPPVLDDLLWELGRDDSDLIGRDAGDVREPERPAGTVWY